MGLPQQSYGGQDADGENQQGRISAAWLIQIELAWLLASALIGWYLGGLPAENLAAQIYRSWAGGNGLGLFVLGNAAGYLIYEEVRMVLSGIHRRDMIAKAVNKAVKAAVATAVAETRQAERAAAEEARQAERAAAEETRQAERIAAEETRQAERAAAEESRQAERAAVSAWYDRQQTAQREGHPFDEPPPGYGRCPHCHSPSG